MNRPWMPLYIADYLADTVHLTTLEHGCYLLLIMSYWKEGKLPQEDAKLARICRMPVADWMTVRDTIAEQFQEGWIHNRIEQELAKAEDISEKRKAARAKVGKRPTNVVTNVEQETRHAPTDVGQTDPHLTTQSQSQSQSQSQPQESELVGSLGETALPGGISAEQWIAAFGSTPPTDQPSFLPDETDQGGRAASTPAPKPDDQYFVAEGAFRITHKDIAKLEASFPNSNIKGLAMKASTFAIKEWGPKWWKPFVAWVAKEDAKGRESQADRRTQAEVQVEIAGKPKRSRFQL